MGNNTGSELSNSQHSESILAREYNKLRDTMERCSKDGYELELEARAKELGEEILKRKLQHRSLNLNLKKEDQKIGKREENLPRKREVEIDLLRKRIIATNDLVTAADIKEKRRQEQYDKKQDHHVTLHIKEQELIEEASKLGLDFGQKPNKSAKDTILIYEEENAFET